MPAGYSGTPLAKKLGIKDHVSVLLVAPPAGFEALLEREELPATAKVKRAPAVKPSRAASTSAEAFDVIVYFSKSAAEFQAALPALRQRMTPACGLWISWPKKSSGVTTDLTETVVREVILDAGLVDNKVCAIDETWSGLRVVIRLKDRPPAPPSRPPMVKPSRKPRG